MARQYAESLEAYPNDATDMAYTLAHRRERVELALYCLIFREAFCRVRRPLYHHQGLYGLLPSLLDVTNVTPHSVAPPTAY